MHSKIDSHGTADIQTFKSAEKEQCKSIILDFYSFKYEAVKVSHGTEHHSEFYLRFT